MDIRSKNNIYPNRIELSQFGATFLKHLPQQIEGLQNQDEQQKQNKVLMRKEYKKRGTGINFQQFANKTMEMINKSVKAIENSKTANLDVNQSKRKLFLNHENWKNEHNVIKYKVSDIQARFQQMKFSEYDWKTNSISMKKQRNNILHQWEKVQQAKGKLLQVKLRHILLKKYPDRANLSKNKKFTIKEYSK